MVLPLTEANDTNRPSAMTAAPALLVRGLRKAYDDVVAVDGLDLEVRNGECFGLLGPNGAGKTTTIEICEGLLARDAGDVVRIPVLTYTTEYEGQQVDEEISEFSDSDMSAVRALVRH